MFLFLSRFYNLAVAFAVAAERSIDTIIYTLIPALPENLSISTSTTTASHMQEKSMQRYSAVISARICSTELQTRAEQSCTI